MKESSIKKVLLIVLDGFGLGPPGPGNPITPENIPFLNSLVSSYKTQSLVAAGLVVGLEWGTYGNSEVGHSAIGTGRVVVQSLARINNEINTGEFYENKAFHQILEHAKKNKSRVHLVGCVSPGGIHSHENHLIALLEFFYKNNFDHVSVHMISDGEDSTPKEGIKSLEKIKKELGKTGAEIASLSGRNYAMDRVRNWKLTKGAWDVMVHGKNVFKSSAEEYIKESYEKNIFDSEIIPASFAPKGKDKINIQNNEGIIFFNFRNDRMRQLVAPFVYEDFKDFDRGQVPENLMVATMTNYDDKFKVKVAYPPEIIPHTLGEIISNNGLKQLRLAEGEKEAHVTNFFSGGRLEAYPNEDRIIAHSRALIGKEYLEHPEMSLPEITENILKNIDKPYSLLVVNFANTDMVAHTGNIPAMIKAFGVVDKALEKIINSLDLSTTAVVITADHGNAEEMIDPSSGAPDTQHSTVNVPIIFVTDECKEKSEKNLANLYQENTGGSLIDVAPSVLHLLGIPQPEEMTGSSLI